VSRAWCSALPLGVRLAVQITPNAKKTEVIGVLANEALIRYLAATLSVPRSAVSITHGQTSKRKLIEIKSEKLTPEGVASLLMPTI